MLLLLLLLLLLLPPADERPNDEEEEEEEEEEEDGAALMTIGWSYPSALFPSPPSPTLVNGTDAVDGTDGPGTTRTLVIPHICSRLGK